MCAARTCSAGPVRRGGLPTFLLLGIAGGAGASLQASGSAGAAGASVRAAEIPTGTEVPARVADIAAGAPTEISVSLYRAPYRPAGAMQLDALGGFALVSEVRSVSLPAGESTLRFEGVADGIEAASALVTGLPADVVEKNRDARVLSPAALIEAALGQPVWLVRTVPKSDRVMRVRGRIRSDNEGIVFEGPDGIEALRCSGLAETFSFSGTTDLAAGPTLSVRVRSLAPLQARVTLSYLAHGFDWMADYAATLSADAKTVDLGAWVTLANANAVSFPDARTQVIAGRLNRATGEVEPIDAGGPILAQCWPRGSTSDVPAPVVLERALALEDSVVLTGNAVSVRALNAPAQAPMAAAQLVEQEQLGDLKLYRVPQMTRISSRQQKQVRLLDRQAVPVELFYRTELPADEDADSMPATRWLRTRNDASHHLGLPLPSGRIATSVLRDGTPLLLAEAPLRDVAQDEEFEWGLGESPDVQVRAIGERTRVDQAKARELPLLPGVDLRLVAWERHGRIEVTSAKSVPVQFELSVILPDGESLIRAERPAQMRNGHPLFRLTIAPGETVSVRYATARLRASTIRPAPP